MNIFLYTLLGIIVLFLLVNFIWRMVSNKRELPCPSWLGWMVELDNPFFRNNSARAIISHLEVIPGMRVLDFGCGPGRLTIPLAMLTAPSGQVTALDIQTEMLERVRAKAEAAGLNNIVYLQAGAKQAGLESEYFDLAVLVTVLGEIPDQGRALHEIFANLKPGAVLSITEVIADPHFQRREIVRRTAVSAGFTEAAFFGSRWSYTINFKKP